jgi:outer membrane lipoprotein SlyB
MPDISSPFSVGSSPNYNIDQILQATKPPAQSGGGFKRVLGGLLGGVGNMFAPGIGGMIGSAISGGFGGIGGSGIMGSDPMQYLQLQQQMNMEARYFETISAIMKSRQDCSMAAIKNIQ